MEIGRQTKSPYHDDNDPRVVVWTELQVPPGRELHGEQWAGYLQPLLHAVGHRRTVWARPQGHPDRVVLATLWYTTSEFRDFATSPSAQLYRESLASDGIVLLAFHETVYGREGWFDVLSQSFVPSFIQLFWVYFSAPMTQDQKAQVSKIRGIRPPVMGFSIPQHKLRQRRLAVQLWATQTEYLRGQKVQLLIWPHFWRDEKAAEWRFCAGNQETVMERFSRCLEEVHPLEWKEEFYHFQQLPRL